MIVYNVLEGGLIRAYSNLGMMIERDGALYCDAIDPESENRVYSETDIPIETEEITGDELTEMLGEVM